MMTSSGAYAHKFQKLGPTFTDAFVTGKIFQIKGEARNSMIEVFSG